MCNWAHLSWDVHMPRRKNFIFKIYLSPKLLKIYISKLLQSHQLWIHWTCVIHRDVECSNNSNKIHQTKQPYTFTKADIICMCAQSTMLTKIVPRQSWPPHKALVNIIKQANHSNWIWIAAKYMPEKDQNVTLIVLNYMYVTQFFLLYIYMRVIMIFFNAWMFGWWTAWTGLHELYCRKPNKGISKWMSTITTQINCTFS